MKSLKEQYRFLLENMPDAYAYYKLIAGKDGKPLDYLFLEVNPAFEKMSGLTRKSLIGRNATELFPDMKKEEFDWIGVYGKVALTGETARFKQYLKSIGRWCDILAYSDSSGYFAVIYCDITSENELRESEKKYRELVENLNEVIYILDENARIQYVLPNVESISGYTPQELAEMQHTDFIHPDDQEGRIKQFMKIMSGLNESSEYRFITKDKRTVWVRTSARPVIKDGRVAGVQGVLTDITQTKEIEEKLKHISFHDALTGLYNRFYLEEAMQRLDTERQLPISVIMADMNGLKMINDTYGHSIGDEVLKQTASVLRSSCRQEDIIARWGGDEFVILLPKTTAKRAEAICQRIKENCRKVYIKDIPVFLALGVATKNKVDLNLIDFLREAEDKMYRLKLEEARSSRAAVLNALLKNLQENKLETEAHTRCMQETAVQLAKRLELPGYETNRLQLLITIHDIGKINVPDDIINKKGPLSPGEWKIVKKHLETGYRIACATEEFSHVAEDILAHHEYWDGSGYPRGLKGEEIPLLARITAIVDAYEVMKAGRPYKETMNRSKIVEEFKRCAGKQFDPEITKIFLHILEQDKN